MLESWSRQIKCTGSNSITHILYLVLVHHIGIVLVHRIALVLLHRIALVLLHYIGLALLHLCGQLNNKPTRKASVVGYGALLKCIVLAELEFAANQLNLCLLPTRRNLNSHSGNTHTCFWILIEKYISAAIEQQFIFLTQLY